MSESKSKQGVFLSHATSRAGAPPPPRMAELTLELTEPAMRSIRGTRRAVAQARVTFRPADRGRGIDGARHAVTAPLGPIEANDLRWYLEDYWRWPFGVFKERASGIVANLPRWGKALFDATIGRREQANALRAFLDAKGEKRITVLVDDRGPKRGAAARAEAAATWLALPWEILADEGGHLFEGSLRARVRRKLPSERALKRATLAKPLRVLLVLARPEDEAASFIDPRASAIPLVEALDPLGESVELTVLSEGTLPALRAALDAAERAKRPYQVVHFDGHGVYDPVRGLGMLCFENADDAANNLPERRAALVGATELGAFLREKRIALVFLEACQSGKTDVDPTASVAAELLKSGVASVVAMSHSVLVATARRFVAAFYVALAQGDRIGAAMATAQRALKDDPARGHTGSRGALELHDWMVPLLFQEEHGDVPLFPRGVDMRPASVEDRRRKAEVTRAELPSPPAHGFVGRARTLLAIDRALSRERRVAITGGGGQGKTALAVEAARWLLAMRRVERVAFVSVETLSEARAVLDAIGRQLVAGYVVGKEEGIGAEAEKARRARLPVEQVLAERRVLIVVDNLESVLPRPGEIVEEGIGGILDLVKGLSEVGETRVLLTSREGLPAGYGGKTIGLPALGRIEGTELLSRVLREKGMVPARSDEGEAAIERLVEAVGGHARSLVMLGELVAEQGIEAVARDVRAAMVALEGRYPEKRERSLIASVRLSLARLPEEVREKVKWLSVFHGAANVGVIAHVLQIELDDALDLCRRQVAVGLADADKAYLLLDPGLRPAVLGELTAEEREAAEGRWVQATMGLVAFLYQQRVQDSEVAFHGARMALTDLLACLTRMEHEVAAGRMDAAQATGYATRLEGLVSSLGMPRVLARVGRARRAIAEHLSTWSRARFMAESENVDRKLEAGDLPGALQGAVTLRDKAEAEGEAYPGAAGDCALAWWRLGRVLNRCGHGEDALRVLGEAQVRFAGLAAGGSQTAAVMETAAFVEIGDVLANLGRLDGAAKAYEKSIENAQAVGDQRGVAVGRGQLGSVRLRQRRFQEALKAYEDTRATFEALAEPQTVATTWHLIGMVHADVGNAKAAEHAYKQALALWTSLGDRTDEAQTLHQLGVLYQCQGRLDEAATLYRQSADIKRVLDNRMGEALSLSNLGIVLHAIGRLDEAKDALNAALEAKQPYGHAAEPWKAWTELEAVERDASRPEAAGAARREALRTYRAYRADGGESMDSSTHLIAAFGQTLRTSGPTAARALLPEAAEVPAEFHPALLALHAFADGSRDPALAADPALNPLHAVELSLILETLAPLPTS